MARPNALEQAAIELLAVHRPVSYSYAAPEREAARRLRSLVDTRYPGAIDRAKARAEKAEFDSRFKGKVPDWLKGYIRRHGERVTSVTVRQSRSKVFTSGHCYGTRIVMTFGSDLIDQKLIALHEIAHSKTLAWDIHGERFYAELRRLLVAEGLLREYGKLHGKIRGRKLTRRATCSSAS